MGMEQANCGRAYMRSYNTILKSNGMNWQAVPMAVRA
jgi:hypothetical protein